MLSKTCEISAKGIYKISQVMQFGSFILNMNKSIAPTVLPKSIIDQNFIKFKFVNPHKDIKDNQNNLKKNSCKTIKSYRFHPDHLL